MKLMRHSDPDLTLARYTDHEMLDSGAALDKLPALNLQHSACPDSLPARRVVGSVAGASDLRSQSEASVDTESQNDDDEHDDGALVVSGSAGNEIRPMSACDTRRQSRAGDRNRTGDIQLGKLVRGVSGLGKNSDKYLCHRRIQHWMQTGSELVSRCFLAQTGTKLAQTGDTQPPVPHELTGSSSRGLCGSCGAHGREGRE